MDDQQRFGDSLSRSLEDTEKLRRKYTKARKFYEDKVHTFSTYNMVWELS